MFLLHRLLSWSCPGHEKAALDVKAAFRIAYRVV
jgi:hypothetical protein